MSRRLTRISLVLALLLSSEVWALGLGDIRLDSALNEPLRAEIQLLSATPEELDNLTVALASAETFARYGLDRPFFLQGIQFTIVRSSRADGNVVQLRSATPMAEPFLTFLVEATWSRGRLLREYTVLLDPPTYAPPAMETAPAVQAPSRSAPADSAPIQRPAPAPAEPARPAPQPTPVLPAASESPKPQPVADDTPYDTAAGGDLTVQRGDTLWRVASAVRPDSRLTMNQTMLAIFEANPQAFGGNINVLRAGATLRIPSADEVFRIDRADALAEAQRQHAEWSGGTIPAPADTRPSLTLVPPDEEYVDDTAPIDTGYDDEEYEAAPTTREEEILDRIAELEAADVPQQQSLIEIRDNELAALRQELARIRGEDYEVPADEAPVDEAAVEDEGPFADDQDAGMATDDTLADEAADAADADAEAAPPPTTIIQTSRRDEKPGLVDQALGILNQFWMWIIGGAVVVVGGLLFWFMRRGREDEDDVDSWQPLDADEMDDDLSATESLRAPAGEESIVVVEQPAAPARRQPDDTIEAEVPVAPAPKKDDTGRFESLEDTFSSETAINLDQSDPIAEADFHMAYGLYDQAADLVNGALEAEPTRHDLLTKLCEIYFVWGNRDAFVDAAGRLKAAVGDADSADWDKIVIMGQQIAGDDALFAGASAAGATRAVDLEFEGDMRDTGALDMELSDESGSSEILDIGAGDADDTASAAAASADSAVDFMFEDEGTVESPTLESPDIDITREMPASDETGQLPAADDTTRSPTIEQQFDALSGTSELPSIDDEFATTGADDGQSADATAEINLDDLGLDVDSMAETELASLDDLDATGEMPSLSDTGLDEALEDTGAATGRNPEVDQDATGVQTVLSTDDTGINEELSDTGFNEALDESLLDATGKTQVLSPDLAVDTTGNARLDDDDATLLASDYGDDDALGDDQETMLASLDDDEHDEPGDFDFAKTEALPKEAFTGEQSLDETGELPAVASTDVDLDLDDLTAALQVSDAIGDTVEQRRDDATVEQPRPAPPEDDDAETLSLSPEDMSDDLHDARTMTEVGTKLDLARAYVDMGDPSGARSILEEVLDEGDEGQRQQAQKLLDSLAG